MSQPEIQQVLEEFTTRWLPVPGIVGTALGRCDGRNCIAVYVRRMTDELRDRLPDQVDGYRVCPMELGDVEAL